MNRILFRYQSRIRNTIYHIKTANWKLIHRYNKFLTGKSRLPYLRLLSASWQHGASFENYYELRFYQKTRAERRAWITASLRHELTRQVNDDNAVHVLKNKLHFANAFKDLLGRIYFSYQDLNSPVAKPSLPEKIVIKHIFGQAGREVIFPTTSFDSCDKLRAYLENMSNCHNLDEYIIEEYITQHHQLSVLSPSSVNTLRIVTFYDEKDDNVDVWGVYLRLGVRGKTDNLATGGIAAVVSKDGSIDKPAVAKDPFLGEFVFHPVTNERIVGFKVPYYKEAIMMVTEAARRIKEVKSIGWDVAITDNGPCLIEGNDNWCMTLLQIPCGHGLRSLADPVCNMRMVYD
jgi:hypothetical protein